MNGGPGASPEGLDPRALLAAVRRALDAALPVGAAAGVAVSGGADSAGLALLAARARPDLVLRVLHVRHGLRDDATDAAAAAGVADRLGLGCTVLPVRVGPGRGPEDAARSARHAALREAASAGGLAAVLLGHTAEDQAETVLLNLVRGAGLRGLAAMRPVRDAGGVLLVRPLLHVRRADVRAAARAAGLPVVHDPTNDDPTHRRGRARREALPALARLAGGPGDPVVALTRLAALAAADDDHLEEEAGAAAAALAHAMGRVRLLRWEPLAALPLALARRVVRRALADVAGRAPEARGVEAVLGLHAEGSLTTPAGVDASRSQGWLVLRPREVRPPAACPLPSTGGQVEGAGWVLEVREADGPVERPAEGPRAGRWAPGPAALDLPGGCAGWSVGTARTGDRVVVGGRPRPLREVFRDRGVPAAVRGLLPVLRDATGAPAWVPGVVVADGVRGPAAFAGGPGCWTRLLVRPSGAAAPLG